MSLIANIDHLARAPGVVSILVDCGAQQAHRGEHHEALRLALLQRDELGVPQTSTAAGQITIMVQREPGGTAAVAVLTGHEIRKSLRRMIRKAARPETPSTAKQADALEQRNDEIVDIAGGGKAWLEHDAGLRLCEDALDQRPTVHHCTHPWCTRAREAAAAMVLGQAVVNPEPAPVIDAAEAFR